MTINTPTGPITALPSQASRIKALTDEQLIASIDAERIADPFEFQEMLRRGLYSRTAGYKRYYGESRGHEWK